MIHPSDHMHGVSVIIPTYKEAGNLPALINRLASALSGSSLRYEVIIVDDDSQDGTAEMVSELSEKLPVSIIIRKNVRGLSSAVLTGFKHAVYRYLSVMDADLSHPPEDVPRLLEPLLNKAADFVVGSRHVDGASISEQWGVLRHLNSQVATLLAAPLVKIKDPMSGFFALDRSLLQRAEYLNPVGYKIGLELMVKTRPKRIAEIPIHFALRNEGTSKLDFKQQLLYLQHLKRLYEYKWFMQVQFLFFCLVGATGIIIDTLTMYILFALFGWPFSLARLPSFILAASGNFQLNRMITFSDSTKRNWFHQYCGFLVVSAIGFIGNWLVSVHLFKTYAFCQTFYVLPVVAGGISGAFVNFTLSKIAVFDSAAISGLTPGVKPVVFDEHHEG
ncbi:MAG: hypothetical protein CSA22_01830 [Deltaproteobacteria bacterium]|nr:MAG: hypothetical protein CSA22_01830 [Deltaproteobacteria bacterium]